MLSYLRIFFDFYALRMHTFATSGHQFFPCAAKRPLKSTYGGHENIDLASLDFLNGSNVQVHQLGKLFLGELACAPLPSHVCPEFENIGSNFLFRGHAPLSRENMLRLNGTSGRKNSARKSSRMNNLQKPVSKISASQCERPGCVRGEFPGTRPLHPAWVYLEL